MSPLIHFSLVFHKRCVVATLMIFFRRTETEVTHGTQHKVSIDSNLRSDSVTIIMQDTGIQSGYEEQGILISCTSCLKLLLAIRIPIRIRTGLDPHHFAASGMPIRIGRPPLKQKN